MNTEIVVMPKLVVTIEGKVTSSNLPEFQKSAKKYVAAINRVYTTDEHFGQAEVDIKSLKTAEQLVKTELENIDNQSHDINEVRKTLAFIGESFRTPRLEIEKEVREQKDSIRVKLMKEASDEVEQHAQRNVALINNEFSLELRYNAPDFYAAIKGLRTIDSVKENIKREKDAAIFSMTTVANEILYKLAWFKEEGYLEHKALFIDMADMIYTESMGFKARVKLRVTEHVAAEKKKEDDLRDKIRLEEEAKAKDKAEAEAKAKAEAEEIVKGPEITATDVKQRLGENTEGGYLPTRQVTEAENVARIATVKEARSDCEDFMAKYMNLDLADPIRNEMLDFLQRTDWVL